MLPNYLHLPYCTRVGVMLINRQGLVLVGRRRPDCARVDAAGCWQMPQGAIAPAEPAREAALRVLGEQAGIGSVQVLAEAPGWFTYELPAELMGVALDGQYCGQKHKWLAMRFLGDDGEVPVGPRDGRNSVAQAWRWTPAAEVPRLAPPLKRELYEDVVATFAPLTAPSRPLDQPAEAQAGVAAPWFVVLPR